MRRSRSKRAEDRRCPCRHSRCRARRERRRSGTGTTEPGHRPHGDPGRGLRHAGVDAGGGGDRLPDRACHREPGDRGRWPRHDRRRLAATAQHHAGASEVRRSRVRARRALPVARSRAVRDDVASAVLGAGRRHHPPAVGDGPRSRPADAMGDQRQRDVHDIPERAALHRCPGRRERPRAHGGARPHEPRRERSGRTRGPRDQHVDHRRDGGPDPAADVRRRSRTHRRSRTTATSTGTSHRDASRASSSRACSRSARTRTSWTSSGRRPS